MTAPAPGLPDGPPVAELELIHVAVPLVHAHRSAHLDEPVRHSVLVAVKGADGLVGLGECPAMAGPGYVTETISVAWTALAYELGPALVAGRPTFSPGAPAASASLADACLDLGLRAEDRNLAHWLADLEQAGSDRRDPRRAVRWCSVLADTTAGTEALIERARRAIDLGASMLKVKFDDPRRLTEVVAELRAVTDVPVAADANGTLEAAQAVELDTLGLAYLEQPLPGGISTEELAAVVRDTATPIALDESITSLDALADLIASGALDIASVKPARMGGVVRAAAAMALCAEHGVGVFVGGMFELGVGRAASLCLAASQLCTEPTDLGPSAAYFESDVVEAIGTDADGNLVTPTGPGIGRTLDLGALQAEIVDRVVIRG